MMDFVILKILNATKSLCSKSWSGEIIIFLLALIIRVAFLFQWVKFPYAHHLLVDATLHDDWALEILSGQWVRQNAFYQAPLYPYLLAVQYYLFGHSLEIVYAIQSVIGALTCLIIYKSTKSLFGMGPAIAAGLLTVFYRPFILSTGLILKETVTFLLLSIACFFLVQSFQKHRFKYIFISGFCLGLTALTRGNAILITLGLGIFWFIESLLKSLKKNAFLFFGFFLAILPCTLHNWVSSHDFVLLNYNGGFNFFLGNNVEANGVSTFPKWFGFHSVFEEQRSNEIVAEKLGHQPKPSEVSDYFLNLGKSWILEHPLDWAKLILVKFRLFWNEYEQPDTYDIQFISQKIPTLLAYPLVGFLVVSVFGVYGLCLGLRAGRGASEISIMGFVYLFSVLIFYVTDRYRMPIVIFLLPFAGLGVSTLLSMSRKKSFQFNPKHISVTVLFFVLGGLSPLGNQRGAEAGSWGQLSSLYFTANDFQKSADAIERGLVMSPKFINAPSFIKGAMAHEKLGHLERANEIYAMGSENHPNEAMLLNNFGVSQMGFGRTESAAQLFDQSIRNQPTLILPYKNMMVLAERLGRKDIFEKYEQLALKNKAR